jgi:hypothetical protein
VIEKGCNFSIMYSVALLIVERETARSRLLYVFELPDGTLRTRPIPDGPPSIGLLTRLNTPSDRLPTDTGGLFSPKAKEQSQARANGGLSLDKAVEGEERLSA